MDLMVCEHWVLDGAETCHSRQELAVFFFVFQISLHCLSTYSVNPAINTSKYWVLLILITHWGLAREKAVPYLVSYATCFAASCHGQTGCQYFCPSPWLRIF